MGGRYDHPFLLAEAPESTENKRALQLQPDMTFGNSSTYWPDPRAAVLFPMNPPQVPA